MNKLTSKIRHTILHEIEVSFETVFEFFLLLLINRIVWERMNPSHTVNMGILRLGT